MRFERLALRCFMVCLLVSIPLHTELEVAGRIDSLGVGFTYYSAVMWAVIPALIYASLVSGIAQWSARTSVTIDNGFGVIAAFGLGVLGLWSIHWFVSSSSLASIGCGSSFSLFTPSARCRRPPVALATALLSLVSAGWFVYEALARRHHAPHS